MVSLLSGKVISVGLSAIEILTAGGVGYSVFVKPNSDAFSVGQEIQIPIHLVAREDSLELYGFADARERELFVSLLNVSGIGPKSALRLLSLGSTEEIKKAISEGDVDFLTRVSGIGKKTAQRIVVELKGKVDSILTDDESLGGGLRDVLDGLAAMGYSYTDARAVIKKLGPTAIDGKTSEALLREALRLM